MSETKKIRVTMSVEVPKPPNFVTTSAGKIPVSELTDDAITELGKAWTERLRERAAEQRQINE